MLTKSLSRTPRRGGQSRGQVDGGRRTSGPYPWLGNYPQDGPGAGADQDGQTHSPAAPVFSHDFLLLKALHRHGAGTLGPRGHFATPKSCASFPVCTPFICDFTTWITFAKGHLSAAPPTDSPARLKAIPHRRWRNSAEGTEDLIEELHALKLPKFRSVFTAPLVWRIWRSRRKMPDETGIYRYALFTNGLQRLPCRFLDLV